MKLLTPLGQLRESEADRAAHHAVMGNLPSLDVSIHQRGADTQEAGGGLRVKEEIERIREALGNDDRAVLAEYGGFKAALQRSAKPQDLPESWVTEGVSIDSYTTWCSMQLTEANLGTGSGLACRPGGEDVTWVHSHERGERRHLSMLLWSSRLHLDRRARRDRYDVSDVGGSVTPLFEALVWVRSR